MSSTTPGARRQGLTSLHATDGVENNALAQGLEVYRAIVKRPGNRVMDFLNPQTMD